MTSSKHEQHVLVVLSKALESFFVYWNKFTLNSINNSASPDGPSPASAPWRSTTLMSPKRRRINPPQVGLTPESKQTHYGVLTCSD
jgi:hypothetical protein